jgi:multidrug efflux pump subunit AcrA (membrane-fusion protein)
MVKTSAIKTQGEQSYVEILIDGILQKKNVVIDGSNDTMTEIVSGLEEGEEVVTQSISTAKTTAGNSSSGENSFRMGGPGM